MTLSGQDYERHKVAIEVLRESVKSVNEYVNALTREGKELDKMSEQNRRDKTQALCDQTNLTRALALLELSALDLSLDEN